MPEKKERTGGQIRRSFLNGARGFHHCTGVITEPVLRAYREVGLEAEILGEAREQCGELRFPARFDVPGAAAKFERSVGLLD